jgi:hypothetical protein
MNLQTFSMNNPKLTNALIIALVAFNVLFIVCWCAGSHHRHHHHYFGREQFFERENYGGDFHGGYAGGFGHHRGHHGGFRHHRGHHDGFGHEDGFANSGDMRGNYSRGNDGGNFYAQSDSTGSKPEGDSGHRHHRKHWNNSTN